MPVSAATVGNTLARAAAVIAGAMILLWLLSLAAGDASIVDIFWGPGFVLVAWAVFAWVTAHDLPDGGEARRLLLAGMATTSGLRLGLYLGSATWVRERTTATSPGERRPAAASGW